MDPGGRLHAQVLRAVRLGPEEVGLGTGRQLDRWQLRVRFAFSVTSGCQSRRGAFLRRMPTDESSGLSGRLLLAARLCAAATHPLGSAALASRATFIVQPSTNIVQPLKNQCTALAK